MRNGIETLTRNVHDNHLTGDNKLGAQVLSNLAVDNVTMDPVSLQLGDDESKLAKEGGRLP